MDGLLIKTLKTLLVDNFIILFFKFFVSHCKMIKSLLRYNSIIKVFFHKLYVFRYTFCFVQDHKYHYTSIIFYLKTIFFRINFLFVETDKTQSFMKTMKNNDKSFFASITMGIVNYHCLKGISSINSMKYVICVFLFFAVPI